MHDLNGTYFRGGIEIYSRKIETEGRGINNEIEVKGIRSKGDLKYRGFDIQVIRNKRDWK